MITFLLILILIVLMGGGAAIGKAAGAVWGAIMWAIFVALWYGIISTSSEGVMIAVGTVALIGAWAVFEISRGSR